jgi:hypothetical protein
MSVVSLFNHLLNCLVEIAYSVTAVWIRQIAFLMILPVYYPRKSDLVMSHCKSQYSVHLLI